jgi:hypothetical protein
MSASGGAITVSETILVWPASVLCPAGLRANVVPFTRSGGRTLGGLERVTRTDRGFWSITYQGVMLNTVERRRCWTAIRNHMGGKAGQIAIPVCSYDTVPWPDGSIRGYVAETFSDGATFSDGSSYGQPVIAVQMAEAAAVGATSVVLRVVDGIDDLAGVRWSHEHALYETGVPISVDGDEWTVPVIPAIRAPIAADADLNFATPTCLVRLADDSAMDNALTRGMTDPVDVSFVEDVEWWNDQVTA